MYYNEKWQLMYEQIDNGYTGSESHRFHVDHDQRYIWGLRYIDDLVMREQDTDAEQEEGYDHVYYHCSDAMFSTVAVLNGVGVRVESVVDDAYGKARHIPPADVSGDGTVG